MGHHHHQNNHHHHHHHHHAHAPSSHHGGGGGFHPHHQHHHGSGQTTLSVDVGGVAIPVDAQSAPYLLIGVLAAGGVLFAYSAGSVVLGIAVVAIAVALVALRMVYAQRAFSARLALIDRINEASERERREQALAGHTASPTVVRLMLAVPSERRAALEARLQNASSPLVPFVTEATVGVLVPVARDVEVGDAPAAMQAALAELEGRDRDTSEVGYRDVPPSLSGEGPGLTVLVIAFVALDVGPLPTTATFGPQLGHALHRALSAPSSKVVHRAHRWLPAEPTRAFGSTALATAFPELVQQPAKA